LRFGLSSTDVVRIQGEPTRRFDALGFWYYDASMVQFDRGRLVALSNLGNLRAAPPPQPSGRLIENGITEDETREIQGLPSACHATIGLWSFGPSTVQFEHGRVVAANNVGNLRVKAFRQPTDANLRLWMSREQVVMVLGLPSFRYDALEFWSYGGAHLEFKNGLLVAAHGPSVSLTQIPPLRLATPSRSPSLAWPDIAQNGDVRGADNDGDGRVEPVFVRGYYKQDGTYVRSHYRASARGR